MNFFNKPYRYGPENENTQPKWLKFSVFVTIALVAVLGIFLLILLFNYNNNVFKRFVDASVKNFESGGFNYHISASINDKTYLDYVGKLEFDIQKQHFESEYHADYDTYEYDSVTYAHGADSYTGNFYGGKWMVESYTDKALDFFSFYRSYTKGEFDAGAAVRFTGLNDKFNAVALQSSVENIFKELSSTKAINDILCCEATQTENGLVVTFTPKSDELSQILSRNLSSAFTSAKEYEKFKTLLDENSGALSKAKTVVSYTINKDKYITDIHFQHTVDDKCYELDILMSEFGNTQVEIPDSFITATGQKQ